MYSPKLSKTNYLIFHKPYFFDGAGISKKVVRIKNDIKLYFNKKGLPDKRTVEYKNVIKLRPGFGWILGGEVAIKEL